MPEHDWQALNQFPLPPLAIPVSAGREYRATQAGVDAAHQLTAQVWKEREDYRQTIEREAFDRLSFQRDWAGDPGCSYSSAQGSRRRRWERRTRIGILPRACRRLREHSGQTRGRDTHGR